jgi:hypothetical protein
MVPCYSTNKNPEQKKSFGPEIGHEQGSLTKGEGSVQLTSLYYLVYIS